MTDGSKIKLDDNCTEVISRLLSRIVHDLNNPLAAIIGFSDLLKNPNLAVDKQQRYTARIYEQAVRLSQIVETISNFSSIPTPTVHPFDLQRAAFDAYTLRQGGFDSAGITLELEPIAQPITVRGDKAVVTRILQALLTNAEQAFKENPGITNKKTIVRCGLAGSMGFAEVIDSGPGVDPEIEGDIFEPFFSTRRAGGLGLGLTVACEQARKMDGHLRLVRDSSSPLPGACFRLELPLDSP